MKRRSPSYHYSFTFLPSCGCRNNQPNSHKFFPLLYPTALLPLLVLATLLRWLWVPEEEDARARGNGSCVRGGTGTLAKLEGKRSRWGEVSETRLTIFAKCLL